MIKTKIPQPLDLAKRLGFSIAGTIGEMGFVELELTLGSRLLHRFTDDPIIRTNQNLLFWWEISFYNSTLLRVFSKVIPDSVKTIDISSMTFEKIFGSIDQKKCHIIKPAFTNDVKIAIISELSLLLGQKDAMRQFASLMNTILENERVSRQTIGLGYGSISKEEKLELETEGVTYDRKRGELSYMPDVSILAATRPLDNKYFTYLKNSGHLSRYHVIQYRLSDKEASKHLHKNFRLDEELLEELKNINRKLSEIKVKKMFRPLEEFTDPIFDDLETLVKDELSKKKIDISTILNPRLKDDVVRELVSHAFLRTASENEYASIDELVYTQEDAEFIQSRLLHFVDFQLNPLIASSYSKVSKKPTKKDRAKNIISDYLSNGAKRSRQQLVEIIQSKERISVPTFEISRKELQEEGTICQPEYGFYKLKQDCTTCEYRSSCSEKTASS